VLQSQHPLRARALTGGCPRSGSGGVGAGRVSQTSAPPSTLAACASTRRASAKALKCALAELRRESRGAVGDVNLHCVRALHRAHHDRPLAVAESVVDRCRSPGRAGADRPPARSSRRRSRRVVGRECVLGYPAGRAAGVGPRRAPVAWTVGRHAGVELDEGVRVQPVGLDVDRHPAPHGRVRPSRSAASCPSSDCLRGSKGRRMKPRGLRTPFFGPPSTAPSGPAAGAVAVVASGWYPNAVPKVRTRSNGCVKVAPHSRARMRLPLKCARRESNPRPSA
jgi:hypothetical protein